MRFMLKVTLPVENGNRAIQEGKVGQVIQAFVEENRPEAMYFVPDSGKRSFLAFLDIKDASQIPVITEPLYAAFNASIEIIPAMVAEDVINGLHSVEQKLNN